jgi:hypothetical protein
MESTKTITISSKTAGLPSNTPSGTKKEARSARSLPCHSLCMKAQVMPIYISKGLGPFLFFSCPRIPRVLLKLFRYYLGGNYELFAKRQHRKRCSQTQSKS